jgi:hypothetical protein
MGRATGYILTTLKAPANVLYIVSYLFTYLSRLQYIFKEKIKYSFIIK